MSTAVSPSKVESARLADQLERSFRGGAWHGPSVEEALAGVDGATARRRPLAGAHSIAELVGHLAFWMETASRRIEGSGEGPVNEGDDWPPLDESDDGWRRLVARLHAAHRHLHAKVLALDEAALDGAVAGCGFQHRRATIGWAPERPTGSSGPSPGITSRGGET